MMRRWHEGTSRYRGNRNQRKGGCPGGRRLCEGGRGAAGGGNWGWITRGEKDLGKDDKENAQGRRGGFKREQTMLVMSETAELRWQGYCQQARK